MSDSGEADNSDTEVVQLQEDHAISGPNDTKEAFEANLVVKGNRSVVWKNILNSLKFFLPVS